MPDVTQEDLTGLQRAIVSQGKDTLQAVQQQGRDFASAIKEIAGSVQETNTAISHLAQTISFVREDRLHRESRSEETTQSSTNTAGVVAVVAVLISLFSVLAGPGFVMITNLSKAQHAAELRVTAALEQVHAAMRDDDLSDANIQAAAAAMRQQFSKVETEIANTRDELHHLDDNMKSIDRREYTATLAEKIRQLENKDDLNAITSPLLELLKSDSLP